jgi:hypothetical protein
MSQQRGFMSNEDFIDPIDIELADEDYEITKETQDIINLMNNVQIVGTEICTQDKNTEELKFPEEESDNLQCDPQFYLAFQVYKDGIKKENLDAELKKTSKSKASIDEIKKVISGNKINKANEIKLLQNIKRNLDRINDINTNAELNSNNINNLLKKKADFDIVEINCYYILLSSIYLHKIYNNSLLVNEGNTKELIYSWIVSAEKYINNPKVEECINLSYNKSLNVEFVRKFQELKLTSDYDPIKISNEYPSILHKTIFDEYFLKRYINLYENQKDIMRKFLKGLTRGCLLSYTSAPGEGKTTTIIGIAKIIEQTNELIKKLPIIARNGNDELYSKYENIKKKPLLLIFGCNSKLVRKEVFKLFHKSGIQFVEAKQQSHSEIIKQKDSLQEKIEKLKKMNQNPCDFENMLRNLREFAFVKPRNIADRQKVIIGYTKEGRPITETQTRAQIIQRDNDERRQNIINKGSYYLFDDKNCPKTIIADALSAHYIINDLSDKFNIVLFFDEPMIGADVFVSKGLEINSQLLASIPKYTILSSATLPNNLDSIHKFYRNRHGEENIIDITKNNNIRIGMNLKTFNQNIYYIFNQIASPEELRNLIDLINENPLFKKMCTLNMLKNLKDIINDNRLMRDIDKDYSKFIENPYNWTPLKISEKVKLYLEYIYHSYKRDNTEKIKQIFAYDFNSNPNNTITKNNLLLDWSNIMDGMTLITTNDPINYFNNHYQNVLQDSLNPFEPNAKFKINSVSFLRNGNFKRSNIIVKPKPHEIYCNINTDIDPEILENLIRYEEYHKLIILAICGIGIYAKNLRSEYTSFIHKLAKSKKLVYVVADDSVIFGVNYSFVRVIIEKDFADLHSIESLCQVMGRAGRVGLSSSAEIIISDILCYRLYRFIVKGKDWTFNEEQNLDISFKSSYYKNELSLLMNKIINKKCNLEYGQNTNNITPQEENETIQNIENMENKRNDHFNKMIDNFNINSNDIIIRIKNIDRKINELNEKIVLEKNMIEKKNLSVELNFIELMKTNFEQKLEILERMIQEYTHNYLDNEKILLVKDIPLLKKANKITTEEEAKLSVITKILFNYKNHPDINLYDEFIEIDDRVLAEVTKQIEINERKKQEKEDADRHRRELEERDRKEKQEEGRRIIENRKLKIISDMQDRLKVSQQELATIPQTYGNKKILEHKRKEISELEQEIEDVKNTDAIVLYRREREREELEEEERRRKEEEERGRKEEEERIRKEEERRGRQENEQKEKKRSEYEELKNKSWDSLRPSQQKRLQELRQDFEPRQQQRQYQAQQPVMYQPPQRQYQAQQPDMYQPQQRQQEQSVEQIRNRIVELESKANKSWAEAKELDKLKTKLREMEGGSASYKERVIKYLSKLNKL